MFCLDCFHGFLNEIVDIHEHHNDYNIFLKVVMVTIEFFRDFLSVHYHHNALHA